MDMARIKCGYDLRGLEAHILSVQIEQMEEDKLQQIYELGWRKNAKRFLATLTLNCASNIFTPPDVSSPVSEPGDLIAAEDSGGRYARHVAWQKPLTATNWTAQVAYVDYVVGDGQRDDTRDFLICDSQVATPCMALSVSKPKRLSADNIATVLSMLGKISVTY